MPGRASLYNLLQGQGEGRFAATGIAQNDNPLHGGDFLSRKKPTSVQVLDGAVKGGLGE